MGVAPCWPGVCTEPLFLYVIIDKLLDFDDVVDGRGIVIKFDKPFLIAEV